MLKIYVSDTKPLEDERLFNSIYETMSDFRRSRVDHVKPMNSKRESLGAGWLLEYALKKEGREELSHRICEGKNGKPEFDSECGDIYFNLSHSGGKVMCAIASEPVGCDIQIMEKDSFKVARRFFSEEEKKYIFSDDTDDAESVKNRFYHIWTMKEAYTKLTGEGILKDFRSFNVLDLKEHFLDYRLDNHMMSVCTQGNNEGTGYEIITIQ